MKVKEKELIKALEASFKAYKAHGARSTAKLKPIHKFLADSLANIWGKEYDLHFLGDENKEMTVQGKYYPKDIDVTVTKNGNPVFCMGIKFVTSNYKQNANNYFEIMMGETANIQAVGNLPYAQILILRHKTPYYLKNNSVEPLKIETINDKDVAKYLRLIFDNPQAHRPDYLGILLIDIDEITGQVSLLDLDKSFSKETVIFLKKKLSLNNFFSEIETYTEYLKIKYNG